MSDPRKPHEDPDAPPSEEELAAARELREALEDPAKAANADAELARALASAWSPRDLSPAQHGKLVEQALQRHDRVRSRRGRVVRVTFGAGALVALAASVLLVVRGDRRAPDASRAVAAVAVSRSTQPLFPERFAPAGGESARIDRIAMARAADLRDNEFAKWGVR